MWKGLSSKNACKTCAVGMGGQKGGMVNEGGHWPEVCKKSVQAMAADLQGAIKPDFWSTYSIEQLKHFTPKQLEHVGRIVQPMIHRRGEQYYQAISWDEALGKVIDKFKSLSAEETFFYFSGRSSNEAGFLLQLFARVYGTNNVNNCSFYCHQASGVGLSTSIGSGTATITLEDVEHADLVFLIGGNPASNHPRLMRTLMTVRRRGGQVIVVNPVIETGLVNFSVPSDVRSLLFGTEIATLYVQPHIGGDLAMLAALQKRIIEIGAHDEAYLKEHCRDWNALKAHLDSLSYDELVRKSGVTLDEIHDMADRYAKAKNVVFSWTMGITHHTHGADNVRAIATLALLRGMVGKPNSGLMPIRGHSNVQGIGSVGVTPTLKKAIFDRLEDHFRLKLPTTPGRDTMACMDDAHRGTLKAAICLGGNLYGSNPDSHYAAESMSRLEQIVYLNTTLNTGHAHGLAEETILLPVLARDEEPEPTTQESMFNYVRLSDGGIRRLEGPRSEVQVIAALARGVLGDSGPIDWQSMQHTGRIREAIGAIVPGFEKIVEIDKTKKEFHIEGRTLHEPKFPTADGRAQLFCPNPPELKGDEETLRLMTVRSEGQFNTVVYEDYDFYRGIDRRDVILVHPDDITRLGLQAGSRVTITSSTGVIENFVLTAYDSIKPGNALMYYPEANVLVSKDLDLDSRTPAFKGVLVTVKAKAPRTVALAAHG
jgi:molybdopterin-dependent oxidoreductase alpha subunit